MIASKVPLKGSFEMCQVLFDWRQKTHKRPLHHSNCTVVPQTEVPPLLHLLAQSNPRSPSHPVSIFFMLTYSAEVLALDSYPAAHTSSILNPAVHILNNYQYLYLNHLTRPEVNYSLKFILLLYLIKAKDRKKETSS